MASTTDNCPWCGTPFVGYGKNHREAKQDAVFHSSNHAWTCPKNPANQEGKDD